MKPLRLLQITALGAVFALAGCGGTAEDPAVFVEAPELEAQGGPGGMVGSNGASPAAYHANVGALLSAFGVAAADPSDPSALNPAIEATGILNTSGGREIFAYAARCALPAGKRLESGTNVYEGSGILSTTASWVTAGLTIAQKEEALTCLIAHLNPLGAHVPLFLSGPSVPVTASSDPLGFTVEEAVWQVKIPGPGQAPIYYAWPRTSLADVCGLLTDLSWITRVCGLPLNTCGIRVRYDFASACTGANGRFTCNGKPAIQTTLAEGALCSLHLGLL